VVEEQRDANCNILGLLIRIKGELFHFLSIYGPNRPCDEFFVDLELFLSKNRNIPVIIGGDWNLTPSPLPVNLNPDTFNMLKIPNEKHTRLLQTIQLKFSLVDAFRILHPLKKDFSYVPRDCTKIINLGSIFFYQSSFSTDAY
jgi:hypothetical protein